MDGVMTEEMAETELQRMLQLMDLDHKFENLEGEDRTSASKARDTVLRALRLGRLVVDSEGVATYTPQVGDTSPLVFAEPTGAVMQAMDRRKEGETMAKTFAMLGAWTGQPPTRFSAMRMRDLTVCQMLMSLFLA